MVHVTPGRMEVSCGCSFTDPQLASVTDEQY